jgi:hypothetical protein
VGDDPDGGTCDSTIAYHFDHGSIDGVDVSGLTIALAVHIPGNVLKGNWRALVFIDDKASKAQEEAILKVYTGQAGRRAPGTYQVRRRQRQRDVRRRRGVPR